MSSEIDRIISQIETDQAFRQISGLDTHNQHWVIGKPRPVEVVEKLPPDEEGSVQVGEGCGPRTEIKMIAEATKV